MSIVPRRIWPGRLDDHAMQGCCAEWSAMSARAYGSSNIAVKRSLLTKNEFSLSETQFSGAGGFVGLRFAEADMLEGCS
jgi:hypothetical protein